MRALFFASAALLALSAAPTQAQTNRWCMSGIGTGYAPDCSFSSYRQCMATARGQNGGCSVNPMSAYDRQIQPGRRMRYGQQVWDNGNW